MNPTLIDEELSSQVPRRSAPKHDPSESMVPRPVLVRAKAALWNQYFPGVPLTDPRWIERCSLKYLESALRIAQAEDRVGRFVVRDQDNIGKYVSGVVNRLKNGRKFSVNGDTVKTATFPITMSAGYNFSESDKRRFKKRLSSAGECLRWTAAKTSDGYGRFKVNGKVISAHYVAFFMSIGCLPLEGELDGQKFNVSHNCRNRDCCNEKHLRVKTKRVNLEERQYAGGVYKQGSEYSTHNLPTSGPQLDNQDWR